MSAHDVDRHTFGVDCWRGDVQPMARAHRHDDIEVNLADVDLEYLVDGRPLVMPAGSISLFWAARPHRLLPAPREGWQAWMTIPLSRALAWGMPQEVVELLVQGEVLSLPAADGGGAVAERFAQWRDELRADDDPEALSRRIALLEIEAVVLRWAIAVASSRAQGDAAVAPVDGIPPIDRSRGDRSSHAGAMIAFLSAHSADDLTVADVAAHVHLHPQYAMALFRRAAGITMGEYLAQCRVAHAQALLLSTDLSVPDVGVAAGFRSQSQFYERFGRLCGQSPAAYRRRLRAAAAVDEASPAGPVTPTGAR